MSRHVTHLRSWRKKAGLTLEEVAAHLGMSHSQLSRIERGEQPYNQDINEALAELYKCNVVDLIVRDADDPETMWTQWTNANPQQRRQISAIVDALLSKPAS